jgi:hypothetical protein
MPETQSKRTNAALWWGLLLGVLGIVSNGLYFLGVPARLVVEITLALPAVALAVLVVGLRRAFAQSNIYRGKVSGSIVTVLGALFFGAALFVFVHARQLPRSAGAPQVGQHIPDFTLPDSTGQQVSLAQLLSGTSGTTPPKAVLLIFYRGYW